MRWCQKDVGSCDFIEKLKNAVTKKRPVSIQLREGLAFIDEVIGVAVEDGREVAVFKSHAAVAVVDIEAVAE